VESIQTQIENLLLETKRPGIEGLLHYMDKAGFYDSPCSSRYHLAQPGGLAEHSLNVCKTALSLCGTLHAKNATHELYQSIIICALLHDLGKAGQYGKPGYTIEKVLLPGDAPGVEYPTPQYHTNKELLYVPHEIRSVAIAQHYIALTEEEQFAILHHNGLYSDLKNALRNNETPLQMILHFADLWACRVIEK
jgi:23S rRNA maturation-related 3'-5' exoribonuclease YhaM